MYTMTVTALAGQIIKNATRMIRLIVPKQLST